MPRLRGFCRAGNSWSCLESLGGSAVHFCRPTCGVMSIFLDSFRGATTHSVRTESTSRIATRSDSAPALSRVRHLTSRPSPRSLASAPLKTTEITMLCEKTWTLRKHSDDELLSATRRLIGAERWLTAKFVAYLAEIEDRRLHLLAGYASMFDFCTRGLGLCENEAFRRIAAARLGRRFPVVHSLLASGAVHLTTLELLREHLADENHNDFWRPSRARPNAKSKPSSPHASRNPRHPRESANSQWIASKSNSLPLPAFARNSSSAATSRATQTRRARQPIAFAK